MGLSFLPHGAHIRLYGVAWKASMPAVVDKPVSGHPEKKHGNVPAGWYAVSQACYTTMGSLYGFGRQDMRCARLQDGAGGTARIGIHAKTLTEILLEGQVHIDRSCLSMNLYGFFCYVVLPGLSVWIQELFSPPSSQAPKLKNVVHWFLQWPCPSYSILYLLCINEAGISKFARSNAVSRSDLRAPDWCSILSSVNCCATWP